MRYLVLFAFFLFCFGCGAKEMTTTTTTLPVNEGKIGGNFSGCGVGAFVNGMENLNSFQTMIGKKLAVVLWYVHWLNPFPKTEADIVDANGSIPLITWEPWVTNEAIVKGDLNTLEAIASGSFESYVRSFLQAAKEWGKPLFLRFAHEMNGDWYPWDGYHNGEALKGPESYKHAWQYIYNVREEVGATNVNLVWCVNNVSQPDVSWNSYEAYYPGDQYVDWVAMDGYNWGWDKWQTFDSVFSSAYQKLTILTSKPLMIGEFASGTSEVYDKASWITDAFTKIKNDYPRIKIFCWFNINKERDWRVNSSPASEAAFRNALQDSHFLSKIN